MNKPLSFVPPTPPTVPPTREVVPATWPLERCLAQALIDVEEDWLWVGRPASYRETQRKQIEWCRTYGTQDAEGHLGMWKIIEFSNGVREKRQQAAMEKALAILQEGLAAEASRQAAKEDARRAKREATRKAAREGREARKAAGPPAADTPPPSQPTADVALTASQIAGRWQLRTIGRLRYLVSFPKPIVDPTRRAPRWWWSGIVAWETTEEGAREIAWSRRRGQSNKRTVPPGN